MTDKIPGNKEQSGVGRDGRIGLPSLSANAKCLCAVELIQKEGGERRANDGQSASIVISRNLPADTLAAASGKNSQNMVVPLEGFHQ